MVTRRALRCRTYHCALQVQSGAEAKGVSPHARSAAHRYRRDVGRTCNAVVQMADLLLNIGHSTDLWRMR